MKGWVRVTDFISAIVFLIISIILYLSLGNLEESSAVQQVSSTFWPKMLLYIFMASSIWLGITSWLKMKTQPILPKKDAQQTLEGKKAMIMTIALICLYAFLSNYVGLLLASPFFLFAFMYLLGIRRYGLMTICSLGATAVIILLFVKILYVPLPTGVGIFRDINLLVF